MNGTQDGDGQCRCDNKIFRKNFFNMNLPTLPGCDQNKAGGGRCGGHNMVNLMKGENPKMAVDTYWSLMCLMCEMEKFWAMAVA